MSDTNEKVFQPHVMLGLGLTPIAGVWHPFSGLGDGELYVPPHPDDIAKGGRTEPIELREDYPVAYPLASAYVELGVYALPSLRIRNRLTAYFLPQFFFNDTKKSMYSTNTFYEGPYHYPPYNRQKYASGDNAYTFVSVGTTLSDSLDVEGLIPMGRNYRLALQAGPSIIAIQHHLGWDRYASIEFHSSDFKVYPGFHLGLGILFGRRWDDPERNVRGAMRMIDLSFMVGFSEDVPVVLLSLSSPGGEISF